MNTLSVFEFWMLRANLLQFFLFWLVKQPKVQTLWKVLERVRTDAHLHNEPLVLDFILVPQKLCHLCQTLLINFVVMTLLFVVVFCKCCQKMWLILCILFVLHWSGDSTLDFTEIRFKMFQICFHQFSDTWKGWRFQVSDPDVFGDFLVKRFWGLELFFDVSMDVDLVGQQQIKTNVKVKFIQDLVSNCKECVTLYIQIHRYVSFVPHFLINFFNFAHHLQLLFLSLYIFIEILFFLGNNSLGVLLFIILLRLYVFGCFWNDFVSREICFSAVITLDQFIFGVRDHFLRVKRLDQWMFEQLCPWYSFILLDCEHSAQKLLNLLWSLDILWKLQRKLADVFQELFWIFSIVRWNAIQNFKYCHSQRPNIAFWTEFFLTQNLRCHVKRWPQKCQE